MQRNSLGAESEVRENEREHLCTRSRLSRRDAQIIIALVHGLPVEADAGRRFGCMLNKVLLQRCYFVWRADGASGAAPALRPLHAPGPTYCVTELHVDLGVELLTSSVQRQSEVWSRHLLGVCCRIPVTGSQT
jgi:hypothetical protein